MVSTTHIPCIMSERSDRPRIGRKGNRKVRTGCRTCKFRKVKCDETKPLCLRCTSSGRVCDGYAPVPPRARRTVPIGDGEGTSSPGTDTSTSSNTTHGSALALARSRVVGLSEPSPSFILGDSNGALALFHHRTAPKLVGFEDGYFWNKLVLQLADTEPAIRHALAAVNSIYDYCEARGPQPPQPHTRRLQHPAYSHGLVEYNKSIGALIQRQGIKDVDESVHLICCVLFVCIEMLAGETQAAMEHFDQGLKLLSNYTAGTEANPKSLLARTDVVRETLAPIFRRLSLQAIMLGRETPLIPLFNQLYTISETRRFTAFRSLNEASLALVATMDEGLRLAHDVLGLDGVKSGIKYDRARWEVMKATMSVRRHEIRDSLQRWLTNFSPFAATAVTLSTDPKERLGCAISRIHHLISDVWVDAILEAEESAFDAHVSSFSSVVHYASEILLMEKIHLGPTNGTVFTFDMGVIAPLYFLVTKCRQRKIRLAGLHLLKMWPRRENVWDPEQAYAIAKRVIEIEDPGAFEPGAPDDDQVPEWKRFHRIDFEQGQDENGNIVTIAIMCRKPLGLEADWEVIREVIPGISVDNTTTGFHFTAK